MVNGKIRGALPAAAVLLPALLCAAEPPYRQTSRGIEYAYVKQKNPPLVYHAVRVDLSVKTLKTRTIRARTDETLARLANRVLLEGGPLRVAINGDYFDIKTPNKIPWGIHVKQGEMLFSPTKKSAFVLDFFGRPFITQPVMKLGFSTGTSASWKKVLAVNRKIERDERGWYLYTPTWGRSAPRLRDGVAVVARCGPLRTGQMIRGEILELPEGGAPDIPPDGAVLIGAGQSTAAIRRLKPGMGLTLKLELTPPADTAIGGGPRLVRDLRVSVEFQREAFSPGHAAYLQRGRHPRAAMGYNHSRDKLILLVTEGRTKESQGTTMQELAKLLMALGARDAMAFDGGASVGLYVDGRIVVDGTEGGKREARILSNALAVFEETNAASRVE